MKADTIFRITSMLLALLIAFVFFYFNANVIVGFVRIHGYVMFPILFLGYLFLMFLHWKRLTPSFYFLKETYLSLSVSYWFSSLFIIFFSSL